MAFVNSKSIVVVVMAVGALGAGGVLHQSRVVAGAGHRVEVARVADRVIPEPTGALPPLTGLAEKERRHRLMLNKLDKPIALPKGLEKMTFGEAKDYFEEHFDVTLLTDFRPNNGNENLLEAEVRLDKVSGIPLRTVLQKLVDQIDAIYLVRLDFIEIVKPGMARPEGWVTGDRSIVPSVHAEFQDIPVDDALRELALETGISVVLDRRALDPAGVPHVTASFDGVCLDTAVEILANMCGLKAVALDRALYITDKDNAKNLSAQQQEQWLRQNGILN